MPAIVAELQEMNGGSGMCRVEPDQRVLATGVVRSAFLCAFSGHEAGIPDLAPPRLVRCKIGPFVRAERLARIRGARPVMLSQRAYPGWSTTSLTWPLTIVQARTTGGSAASEQIR